MATAEFSKFAGILSAALSQHHLPGFEIAQWNIIALQCCGSLYCISTWINHNYIYVHMCIYTYVIICIYMCVHVCICVCVYVYVYTPSSLSLSPPSTPSKSSQSTKLGSLCYTVASYSFPTVSTVCSLCLNLHFFSVKRFISTIFLFKISFLLALWF